MKGLAALLAMGASVLMLLAITLVEMVAKLAPLLAAGGCVWAGVIVWRAHQRRRDLFENRARTQLSQALTVPHHSMPAPTPTLAPCLDALPPRMHHQERVYLVRGDDTGLGTLRPDGYLKVSADKLPPARPIETHRLHGAGRSSRRRRRPDAPKTRP